MRPMLLALVSTALLVPSIAHAQEGAPAAPPAASPEEDAKTLYALGYSMGRNLGQLDLSPEEIEIVRRAFDDAAAGRDAEVAVDEYRGKIQAFARARAQRRAEAEKEKGAAFLAEKAAEPGAETTESGMVYRELAAGFGASPAATDTVRVHYRGTLIDGTEFDSSYAKGEPAEFPLGRVVRCWTEGIQKMKVGGHAELVCPSDLAYGDRGRPSIPPGATLVFDVELMDIVTPAAPRKLPPPERPRRGDATPKPEGHD